MIKVYVVQNAEGKYLVGSNYDGKGAWVDNIDDARVWLKLGQPRSQVTWFAQHHPDKAIPNIVELTAGNPVVLDESKRVQKVIQKKAEKEGMSTKAYANKVIRDLKGNTKNETQKRLLRQAVYAKNLIGFKK